MLQNLNKSFSKEKRWKKWNREMVKLGYHKKTDEKILGFDRFVKYNPKDWNDTYTPDDRTDFTGVYVMAPEYGMMSPFEDINLCTRSVHSDKMERVFDEFYWYMFGLADNASQIIDYYNELKAKGLKGNHVIIMRYMDNFRWHKWGRYIGNYTPSHEYFSDEDGIKYVFSFDIYKVV